MFCGECGSRNEDNATFCGNCGSRLGPPPSYPPPTYPPSSESQYAPSQVAQRSQSTGLVFSGNEYIIEQKIVAMRETFGIKDRNGNLLSYVKRRMASVGPQFWFETPDGTRLGEMHGKVFAVRPTFEIYDPQGLVAVARRKVLKLIGSEWWLEDSTGNEIARIKGNIMEHDFSIQSPTGSQLAQVHKRWVTVRDSYAIEILAQEISPYIIVAYVIAMDHAQWKNPPWFTKV